MLKIKNWSSFQSYKDRNPPWIRLHKRLLDDFNFQKMSAESRALLPMLWLLTTEDEEPVSGMLRIGYEEIAFRLRIDQKVVKQSIDEIIRAGFVERVEDENMPLFDDKTTSYETVTEPLRSCHPETETETDNNKKGEIKKNKISLKNLSVDHVADWLGTKRVSGVYTNIDEHRLLEMFKDYCTSKGRTYKDYVAGFRNAFEWSNAPRKGEKNAKNRSSGGRSSKADRVKDSLYGDGDIIDVTPSD